MAQIWKNWCRLCGNDNSQVDVFMKDENFATLAETIQKFFSINIYTYDESPTKVCRKCHKFLCEIINYFLQAHKVQEMFCDLQFNDKFDITVDLDEIRIKYGVSIKNLEYKSEFEIENVCQSSKYIIRNFDDLLAKDTDHIREDVVKDDCKIFNENSLISEENAIGDSDCEDIGNLDENNDSKLISKLSASKVWFTCKEIENSANRKSCRKYIKYHRKREKHKKNIQEENSSKEPVAVCELCNKKFLNKGGYTFHLKAKHSLVTETIACKFCGKLFKAISDHQKHEATHLPPEDRRTFPCIRCNKKFFSEGNLNAHIRVVHVRDKSFICEECGKGYVTVDALNSHKVVHSEEKPFKCSKCSKSFKRLPTLKLHLESHENHKFICSICGTQLNSRALLRRHMVVHSDEKKYKCNFCEKEFKRPDAFKHHLILHTGLKPYECPFCELTFANGSNCRKHQKTTHPIELAAAEAEGVKRVCKNVPKIEQLRAVNNGALNENQDCELESEMNADNTISMTLLEKTIKGE